MLASLPIRAIMRPLDNRDEAYKHGHRVELGAFAVALVDLEQGLADQFLDEGGWY